MSFWCLLISIFGCERAASVHMDFPPKYMFGKMLGRIINGPVHIGPNNISYSYLVQWGFNILPRCSSSLMNCKAMCIICGLAAVWSATSAASMSLMLLLPSASYFGFSRGFLTLLKPNPLSLPLSTFILIYLI